MTDIEIVDIAVAAQSATATGANEFDASWLRIKRALRAFETVANWNRGIEGVTAKQFSDWQERMRALLRQEGA